MGRRKRRERRSEPLPPPLPHETRTVGQLVAETIRFYSEHFWACLALGVAPAIVDGILLPETPRHTHATISLTIVPVMLALSYLAGSLLVTEQRRDRKDLATAALVGVVVFIPFPLLLLLYLVPGVLWLALFVLAVPAAAVERTGFYASLKRSLQLSLADFWHALGSVLTLTILFILMRLALWFTLRGGSGTSQQVAAFLADLVLAPILFLGVGMLYLDQRARVGSGSPTERSRDADVHPAVEADRPGRPDAEVEPGSPGGGQP